MQRHPDWKSLPPTTLHGQWLPFEFHKTDNTITARRQQWSQPPNMPIAPLRPGYFRIVPQTTASLQFQLGTQTNTFNPQHVGTHAGQSSNIEATECGVKNTMLWMSKLLCGPNRPAIRHTYIKEHKGAHKRQDEKALLALHCLTTDHAFDWDRATMLQRQRLNTIARLSKPEIRTPAVYFHITLVPNHFFYFCRKNAHFRRIF